MTMPANPPVPYEPIYPRIVLMATDSIEGDNQPTIRWGVGDAHPFMPKMKIVAMYLHDGVVEIYSFDGARTGIRELIPVQRARLIREEMPIDIYGEELRHAELGFPDDDDPDDGLDDPSPGDADTSPLSPPVNGQATS